MPAVRYDLSIEQGATFRVVFEWRDSTNALIDTSGYTPHLQARTKPGGDLLLDLDTGNGLTLDGGVLSVRIGADVTATLTRGGVYDLELHGLADPTDVVRLAWGSVKLSKQVTLP